ncbi:hypothetical protein [Celerinatantimonas sp. YJH-8]|uniref:hypothetical protein n=1 Tax=Celerinatantimonas sp. YJH-8 TaxID=3228714 RepID=UPI0038BF3645
MPLIPLLLMFGAGGATGLFGGLFASDAATSLSHVLGWLLVLAAIGVFIYLRFLHG